MLFQHPNIEMINEVKSGQTGTGLLIERDGYIKMKDDDRKQIAEDIEHGSKFIIPECLECYSIMQRYDALNYNGRIYPKNVLIPAVERYDREYVQKRRAISALDHPASSSLSGHDVAHLITEMHWEGDTLVGTLKLHTSPGFCRYGICSTSGDLVANMLIQDYLIGVSSRAVGSVENKNGTLYVGDDLEIIAFDSVLQPSTVSCYTRLNRDELKQFMGDRLPDKKSSLSAYGLSERIERVEKLLM